MNPKRYVVYRPKQKPPSWEGDRRGELSRDNYSIMDREQTEPNPKHPGYKRYKIIESGLYYIDAYKKCVILNQKGEAHGTITQV